MFSLSSENPFIYQQCNAHDVENSNLIGHRVTTAQVQSLMKVHSTVEDVDDLLTPPHTRFSCLLFAVCVNYDVSCCVNLNFLHDLCYSIVTSVRTGVRFLLSSIASVGNGS